MTIFQWLLVVALAAVVAFLYSVFNQFISDGDENWKRQFPILFLGFTFVLAIAYLGAFYFDIG